MLKGEKSTGLSGKVVIVLFEMTDKTIVQSTLEIGRRCKSADPRDEACQARRAGFFIDSFLPTSPSAKFRLTT
jgi:hypothetical protein